LKNVPTLRRLLAASAVAAACALAPLSAGAFSSVVIFGDSLSDSGNNAQFVGVDAAQVITGNSYVPVKTYAPGTYSNGAVWATTFASALGLPLQPSLSGGTNYAYGGARTDGLLPPGLRRQLRFYMDTAPSDVGDVLYVVAGGGNNARDAIEQIAGGAPAATTIATAAADYANDIDFIVNRLENLGAQHIVVWDTPNVGLAPATVAAGGAALGTAVAAAFNVALAGVLADEPVTTFDIFGLNNAVFANPGAYGLANVTDACGAIAGCNPSTYLFWDGIHPTSAGHQIIANAMLAAVPEPAAAWTLALGLVAIGIRRRLR
jgi:outer membrane lipase/esterase